MSQGTFLEHNRTALLLLSELCLEIRVNGRKCHDWLAYRNIVGPGFPVDNSSLTNELRPSLSSMDSGLAVVEFEFNQPTIFLGTSSTLPEMLFRTPYLAKKGGASILTNL